MYLRKSISNGKIYLSFVNGYRDKEGKVKQKTIKKLGYLEDLKKEFDNPEEHFRNLAKEMSKETIDELIIKNINSKVIDSEEFQKHNLGYIIIKKLYKELQIDKLLKEKQKKLQIEYNLNSIFEMLIYSRILYPNSKLSTYNNRNIFFEKFNFFQQDMYRSLDYFGKYKDEMLTQFWNLTKDKYGRDITNTFYDTTNYYFEISYNDDDTKDSDGNIIKKGLKKKGPSKEHRKTPIIQMGLLMDNNGIPMAYDLFPGNESEKLQMRPTLKKTKAKFGIDRTIIVADRGQNTSDNVVFIAGKNNDDKINHDGYVYGQSIIGGSQEFKDWAINPEGFINEKVYDENGDLVTYKVKQKEMVDGKEKIIYVDKPVIFKHKSRIIAKTVTVKKDNNRNVKYEVYQKQLVYYSKKYAERQKKLREQAIAKAKDLIANPGKYTKETSYGCTKYINNIAFVKKTGEVANANDLSLNLAKIQEEEKFDGYYSIVTSEKNMTDKQIRDVYKGLWKIEETFKVTKSELETRPVFVWSDESIESHFLSCFVSLLIVRLLEKLTKNKYSIEKIIESLRNYESTKIEHDIYLQNFRNEIIKDFEKIFDIDLSKKYLKLSEIRKKLDF